MWKLVCMQKTLGIITTGVSCVHAFCKSLNIFHSSKEMGNTVWCSLTTNPKFRFTARRLKPLKIPWKVQAVQTTNHNNYETLHECYVDSRNTHTTASWTSSTWIEIKNLNNGRKEIQSKLLKVSNQWMGGHNQTLTRKKKTQKCCCDKVCCFSWMLDTKMLLQVRYKCCLRQVPRYICLPGSYTVL